MKGIRLRFSNAMTQKVLQVASSTQHMVLQNGLLGTRFKLEMVVKITCTGCTFLLVNPTQMYKVGSFIHSFIHSFINSFMIGIDVTVLMITTRHNALHGIVKTHTHSSEKSSMTCFLLDMRNEVETTSPCISTSI